MNFLAKFLFLQRERGATMKILLSNDDGIYAEGLRALANSLKAAGHDIITVAPAQEQSANGHAITIRTPLRVTKINNNAELGQEAYKVNGTPADCIKLALQLFADFSPDLVITGINHGQNLGYDVFYSGTVAAATEGYLQGYNSIALSLAKGKMRNFSLAASLAVKIIEEKDKLFDEKTKGPLNINFPDIAREDIQGLKVTRLAEQIYERFIEERVDPAGRSYFWFVGKKNSGFPLNTDIGAIQNNYISLTPLNCDLNDDKKIKELNPQDLI